MYSIYQILLHPVSSLISVDNLNLLIGQYLVVNFVG